jgi:hypothetical protein
MSREVKSAWRTSSMVERYAGLAPNHLSAAVEINILPAKMATAARDAMGKTRLRA